MKCRTTMIRASQTSHYLPRYRDVSKHIIRNHKCYITRQLSEENVHTGTFSHSISAQLRSIFVSRNQDSGMLIARARVAFADACPDSPSPTSWPGTRSRNHCTVTLIIDSPLRVEYIHAHTRVGRQRIEGRRTGQMTGGLMEEIETGRRFFFTLLDYFRLTPRLWHFFFLSASVAAKICCSRLFRGGRFFLSLMEDASPPLLHPLLSPPSRIPFILISRSSSCICHLLSSLRDKYCLIIVILILFCRIVNQEFNGAFQYFTKNELIQIIALNRMDVYIHTFWKKWDKMVKKLLDVYFCESKIPPNFRIL